MEMTLELKELYQQAGRFAGEVSILAQKHPEQAASILRVAFNLLTITNEAWTEQDTEAVMP